MRSLLVSLKVAVLAVTMGSANAAFMTYTGNAYGGSGVRASFEALMPELQYDTVNLTTECVSPCVYSYSSGPLSLTNISGTSISGVTFVGSNSSAGAGLYARPLGTRNSSTGGYFNYNQLNGNNLVTPPWPQWTVGLASAGNVSGTPTGSTSISASVLPAGTRSVAFDYGSANGTTYTIRATTASGALELPSVSPYNVGGGYTSSGPGFYGVTSTEDILTVTIIANATASNWIINLANFRYGIQLPTATPEPSTQLALGAALITISLLLRTRSKSARGGNA